SNLVKTACFGEDPNWGRIIAALGASGISMDKEKVVLTIADLAVFSQNTPQEVLMSRLKDAFKKDRIDIEVDLGAGDKSYYVYTSDLSHEYVKINAEYST
ncbi:MAG TPA: bifunctional ornithine acetyltransferase/N-acetylglutamate synthase, partial [Smithella sp.]|nr:bifunctional ornithine acetyltransferase/N-acetylglutamate synthase [Smithella sp.]